MVSCLAFSDLEVLIFHGNSLEGSVLSVKDDTRSRLTKLPMTDINMEDPSNTFRVKPSRGQLISRMKRFRNWNDRHEARFGGIESYIVVKGAYLGGGTYREVVNDRVGGGDVGIV